MKNKIIALYELFYRRLYNNESYIYSASESAHKQIDKFLLTLDKKYTLESIGDQFIVTYFTFQFAYWSELDISAYSGRVVMAYIIGPKAFKRWLDRNTDFDYTFTSTLIEKTKVPRGEALNLIKEVREERHDLLKHEELEKARFTNTERQLTHCLENTTLYSSRSVHCLSCKEKTTCKDILEKRYPQIFHHRFKRK